MKAQKRDQQDDDLLLEVQALVIASGMSTLEASQKIGVGQRWLHNIMSGATLDPGYKRLQHVKRWFADQRKFKAVKRNLGKTK